jgi:hypothetical protein
MRIAELIVDGIELYALIGLVLALWFVTFGVTRAMAHPGPVTIGARLLLIPAAAGLWPYILRRCLGGPR